MCIIWGLSDVSTTPKTNRIYLRRHKGTSKNSRHSRTIFVLMIVGNLIVSEIENIENDGKDGRREILKIRLKLSWNLEYGINIFQKAWHEMLVIWDHWNSEALKLWNFGTLNLRNSKMFYVQLKELKHLIFSIKGIPLPLNIPTPTPAPPTTHPPPFKWIE